MIPNWPTAAVAISLIISYVVLVIIIYKSMNR